MQDRPSLGELLEAVRHFLETEVAPGQTDQRARFRTLVAINALTILEREDDHEAGLVRDEAERLTRLLGMNDVVVPECADDVAVIARELNEELARRIREGDVPEGVLDHLRRVATAKLQVASPRYLGRYGEPDR